LLGYLYDVWHRWPYFLGGFAYLLAAALVASVPVTSLMSFQKLSTTEEEALHTEQDNSLAQNDDDEEEEEAGSLQ